MSLCHLFPNILHRVISDSEKSSKDDEPGNPIGELQEFTQKKLLKPPVYEFVTEQGPPHAREFICNIKLGKFSDRGNLSFISY